jgi:phytoene/squalene synthetase
MLLSKDIRRPYDDRGLVAMVLGIVHAELDRLPRRGRVQIIEAALRHIPRSTGRPHAIEPAVMERIRAKLRAHAESELKYRGKLPRPQSRMTVELVCRWAEDEGVIAGDRTLRRQIIEPVLRDLKRSN